MGTAMDWHTLTLAYDALPALGALNLPFSCRF
jgi:hypothetical protein